MSPSTVLPVDSQKLYLGQLWPVTGLHGCQRHGAGLSQAYMAASGMAVILLQNERHFVGNKSSSEAEV